MTGLGPRVRDVGELELLRRLEPYLDRVVPGLHVGAGDDAAVWEPESGCAVAVTTDSLVDGVHFIARPGDSAYNADLGWKLLAVSLSDLAATGARPGPAFLSLALPANWPVADVEALYGGLSECAREFGASLAGGNLSGAETAVLTSTCLGQVGADAALRRGGGEPGWEIAVTGAVGGASAAVRSSTGRDVAVTDAETAAVWAVRLRRPVPRVAAGLALVEAGIEVCIDVSDGLYLDAARCPRYGLGAVIDIDVLPVETGVREAFPTAWLEVAGGGEDYELLFSGPPGKVQDACRRIGAQGLQATVIGAVVPTPGVRLRAADGEERPAPGSGHQHFAS